MPRIVHIQGKRGAWTAEVEGRHLAVLHSTWRQGPSDYHDPMLGVRLDGKRYGDLVDALKAHDLVVVQKDAGENLDRAGYVGVFRFKDLLIGTRGEISLTLTERYADHR